MQAILQAEFAYHKAQAGVNSSIQSLVMGTAAAQCVLVERPCARGPILGCIQEPFPLSSASATQNSGETAPFSAAHPAQHIPSSTGQQQSA